MMNHYATNIICNRNRQAGAHVCLFWHIIKKAGFFVVSSGFHCPVLVGDPGLAHKRSGQKPYAQFY